MNTSKLLAVAFAASLVGSAALAQTQAATDDTSVQVQPACGWRCVVAKPMTAA